MATSDRSSEDPAAHALLRTTAGVVLVIAAFWLLWIGEALLIPLVLALFVWFLIEALNGFWKRVHIFEKPIPRVVLGLLSALVVFGLCYAFLSLIASNVKLMAEAAEDYQGRIAALYEQAINTFGIDERTLSDSVMERIDLGMITAEIGAALGNLLSNGILIAMYVVFLILERNFFDAKLRALIPGEGRRASVRKALARIDRQVKIYLGVKISVSLLTAVGAYIVMRLMNLDFAGFWAVLVFTLNFIPYIGSTVASLLPAILALAQFGNWTQPLLVFVGIQAVQMTVGFVVEPAMMGKSLNISPLTVMLALSFWGLLWGIPGMFLSVPVTVVIMIACAHFDSTRWVAVALSKDGAATMADREAA